MSNMIIVTGGAGFIGSNLLAGLEERGRHELVICDRLGHGEKWRNIAKREIARFLHPDELLPFIDANTNGIEMIFHLGAISSTTEPDADLIVTENFKLSLAIWERCARAGIRLVYASSAATYGDGSAGFDDDASIEALAKLRPLNAYGWSKHVFDRRVARIIASGGAVPPQWAGLKFFNVYGPNEGHKTGMMSVAAQVYPKAAAGETATLFRSHHPDYADGGQLRDFVWVGDCVDVMLWLLDQPHVSGLYNLGSGKARSFLDLASAVYRAAGREPAIRYVDTPVEIREKYQYFTEATMSRLQSAGYNQPMTELEDGITAYVRDFLAMPDSYR